MNEVSIDCKISIEINKIKQESNFNNDEVDEYSTNIHKAIKESSSKINESQLKERNKKKRNKEVESFYFYDRIMNKHQHNRFKYIYTKYFVIQKKDEHEIENVLKRSKVFN